MKRSPEPELQENEPVATSTEHVTLSAIGNGQYDVRLRIAGMDKSQLIRVPAHGQVTFTGPIGSYVFDAISRRLLFQIQPELSQAPQQLSDYY
jgi:hypothetical protein